MSPSTSRFSWRALSLCLVISGVAGGPLEAADPTAQRGLSAPDAKHIPAAQLELAARQAVANGAATILARILASGNDTGLAYPPQASRKLIGFEEVAARKVTVELAVYKDEWKDVEQMVPEMSEGMPTGRFIPGKVRKLVSRTKIGTKPHDTFVPDPAGTDTMKVPKYERSGPDLYEQNLLGLNGMALYVLARAGLGGHAATRQFAKALDERIREFGVSDHTFDVAWLAAGFSALGAESPYRERAEQLIGKLIDGQIREKGDPQGLWGPVCISYPYFAKLLEIQDQMRLELEVNLPKKLEAANPQQQVVLAKQGQEMRKVYSEFTRTFRDVSSYGLQMQKITEPFTISETARLPALPLYVYTRVVADVESTMVAAFALAEAKRAGLLPRETDRVAIRGKKVAVPEKTATALKAAAARVAQAIGSDGGCSMLTLQAVNHGFDKCRIPIPGVPAKEEPPPLFAAETACSCANGLAALESLATIDADVVKGFDAERDRARKRVTAIAERWYTETAPDPKSRRPWASVYDRFSVSKAALKESAALPLPEPASPPLNELPWGGVAAKYAILPALATVFDGESARGVLENGLYRQIAYRLVGLQDVNGQWLQPGYDVFSSGKDALALDAMGMLAHQQLNHRGDGVSFTKADPVTFQVMLNHYRANELKRGGWAGAASVDPGVFATLASMLFLLQGIDGPVDVAGITLRPDASGATEPPATNDKQATSPRQTPSLLAVTGAERPNAERASLLDAVLAAQQIKPPVAPAAKAEGAASAPAPAAVPAPDAEKEDDGLGSIDDLLEAK